MRPIFLMCLLASYNIVASDSNYIPVFSDPILIKQFFDNQYMTFLYYMHAKTNPEPITLLEKGKKLTIEGLITRACIAIDKSKQPELVKKGYLKVEMLLGIRECILSLGCENLLESSLTKTICAL